MTTKLNQLVAIAQTAKANANKATAPLFHAVKTAGAFDGVSKTYEPIEEGGEQLAADNKRVQVTVDEVLTAFDTATSRMLDVVATVERTNQTASADVVVDGRLIIADAPVTFLMQFEKHLTQEVRGLVLSLPVLDSANDWSPSETQRSGVSETEVVKRNRTKKVQKPIVLYPAEGPHPAQTQLITDDVLAGYWSERKYSGAIPVQRKQALLDRVDKLIAAVAQAREQANSAEVIDLKVGAAVNGYLFS